MRQHEGRPFDPSRLEAFDPDEKHAIRVVIETPRGSRNKASFDEELGFYRLKKVLPEGMTFPYDFGFVPSTLAEDGDPLDVLVLMDEAAFTGCLIICRVVGVILGEQGKKKDKLRNDRIVAVAIPSRTHGEITSVSDLNSEMLDEVEKFFVNYHGEYGQKYRVVGCKGPRTGLKLVERAAQKWRAAHKHRARR
jgi:inorganic pyrophosphatase